MAIKVTTAHEIIDDNEVIYPPARLENGDWIDTEIEYLPDAVKQKAETLWTEENVAEFITIMEKGEEGEIL